MARSPVVAVVGCSAGGVEELRAKLVQPLVNDGFGVAVTLTPTAHAWLRATDEVDKLEDLTGLPVRCSPRVLGEASPHPPADVFVVAPATANTVAKLALGIADNQALTVLCESLGTTPMLVFPRINAAHARHPSWGHHLEALRGVDVRLVDGEDVWPLYEPRTAPPNRELPWRHIRGEIHRLLA